MTRQLSLACTTLLLALTAGCSGSVNDPGADPSRDGRQFTAKYDVRLDPDRTLHVELEGAFTASEDKSNAKAGKTNILVHTTGRAKVTNISDGRDTDDFDHGFQVFLPVDVCPDLTGNDEGKRGKYCSYDMFHIDAGDLKAGKSQTIKIDKVKKVAEVKVDKASGVLDALTGSKGVLVSADRVFWNRQLEKLNPTCKLPGGDGLWVTYFSESQAVNACSTEPE